MKSHHVLIIEDSPEDRATYRRLLSRAPGTRYRFSQAETVEEGLVRFSADPPDCVLLDYGLPGMDGLAFFAALREDATVGVAVVVLTGQGNEAIAVEAMKRGAEDYLKKSDVTQSSLARAVGNAIERATLERRVREQQAALERLVITDELTGLCNRRYLTERLGEEVEKALRYSLPLSLLLLDLDHFKFVNDRYGHLMGDTVLKTSAAVIRGCVRSIDIAARYGGEELCVVTPYTSTGDAHLLAERIRKAVRGRAYRAEDGTEFSVTCSIGTAGFDESVRDAEGLLARADAALYRAKDAGRDRAIVWEDAAPRRAAS